MPAPRPLGIGFPYVAALPADLYSGGVLDFVELTPEGLCRERRDGARRILSLIPAHLERARLTCGELPMVVHGVELSIGSAHGWNVAYLEMLDALWAAWPFRWHSEHLGFQTISSGEGGSLETGLPLPLPNTFEAVDLVAPRAAALVARYGVPFLLENAAHYFSGLPGDAPVGGEVGLMNRICQQGGCGQLLDLHNLYCNAINFGWNVREQLARVRWDLVREVHVAGGSWREGFYMDGHDGSVPEPVWELLEEALPLARNVAGVVFEVLDEVAPRLGIDLIVEELERARQIWTAARGRGDPAGARVAAPRPRPRADDQTTEMPSP